jgi:hypothetical protein
LDTPAFLSVADICPADRSRRLSIGDRQAGPEQANRIYGRARIRGSRLCAFAQSRELASKAPGRRICNGHPDGGRSRTRTCDPLITSPPRLSPPRRSGFVVRTIPSPWAFRPVGGYPLVSTPSPRGAWLGIAVAATRTGSPNLAPVQPAVSDRRSLSRESAALPTELCARSPSNEGAGVPDAGPGRQGICRRERLPAPAGGGG